MLQIRTFCEKKPKLDEAIEGAQTRANDFLSQRASTNIVTVQPQTYHEERGDYQGESYIHIITITYRT